VVAGAERAGGQLGAQGIAGAEQRAGGGRQLVGRPGLARDQVGVEADRAADGLRRVVDDVIEARQRAIEVGAEQLDARRVAEIEAVQLEPMAPLGEVGLARVAHRGVAR
jgi:hypothetical protein